MEFVGYISYTKTEIFFIIDTADTGFWVCCWLSKVCLLPGEKSSWSCLAFNDPELDPDCLWWIKWGKRRISTSGKGSLWYTNLLRTDIKLSKYLQADWRNTSLLPEWNYTV